MLYSYLKYCISQKINIDVTFMSDLAKKIYYQLSFLIISIVLLQLYSWPESKRASWHNLDVNWSISFYNYQLNLINKLYMVFQTVFKVFRLRIYILSPCWINVVLVLCYWNGRIHTGQRSRIILGAITFGKSIFALSALVRAASKKFIPITFFIMAAWTQIHQHYR